ASAAMGRQGAAAPEAGERPAGRHLHPSGGDRAPVDVGDEEPQCGIVEACAEDLEPPPIIPAEGRAAHLDELFEAGRFGDAPDLDAGGHGAVRGAQVEVKRHQGLLPVGLEPGRGEAAAQVGREVVPVDLPLHLGAERRVNPRSRPSSSGGSYVAGIRRRSMAFTATITVERLIISAPVAGDSTTPHGAANPAASGMAITLYPVAQNRFWTIFV